MDSGGSQNPRKSKRRFIPRLPPPRRQPIIPANTQSEEETQATAQQLANRLNIRQRRPQPVTTAPSEVALQPGSSSRAISSFGVPKIEEKGGSDVKPSPSADEGDVHMLDDGGAPVHTMDDGGAPVTRTEGDYVEPWDYENSYYPTVLPLRKPNSGDPELINQEEFGDVAKHRVYDEKTINSAKELGLTKEQRREKQMIYFQFPSIPIIKQPTEAKTETSEDSSRRTSPFEGLREGFMGKMLVYKSGAVKLKLGDFLYDVSPGKHCKCNDLAVINIKGRNCGRVGCSMEFAVVSPDLDHILNSASDKKTQK